MDRVRLLLGGLCDYGRPLILEQFVLNSCIASTAIAIDALREMGIAAYPLKVRTSVINAAMLAKIEQEGRMPQNAEERRLWQHENGAYSLGIGYEMGDGQPSVHLVAILPEEMLMLDITLDQASRPQHNILLHPGYGPVTEEFLSGAEPLTFMASRGVLVRYDADPQDDYFKQAPDWTKVERREKILQKVMIKLRMIERSREAA